jgi:hypothetical protein
MSVVMALWVVAAAESTAHAQPAPNCDQLQAQIAELVKQQGPTAVAKQQLDAAARAVVRARDARAAGDSEHGIELEALAADYVATARMVMRAASLEAQLMALQSKQTELETIQRQTETLLEATIAQRERTKAVLQQALELQQAKKTAAPKAEPAKNKKRAKK